MSLMERGGAKLARAVEEAYTRGLDDYHMEPLVLVEDGETPGKVEDGDSVIFCCRRGEREIELTELFTQDPAPVERTRREGLFFVPMTLYHDKFKDLPVAFAPSKVEMPLAQVLSLASKTQLHCAESEKFAHVTYFFNGGENEPFPGEIDVQVPSPKGVAFEKQPQLSLPQVAREVVDALGRYDFIVANFANGDVIGHTGDTEAKLEACRHVSDHLEQVVTRALDMDYVVAVTADHGNIEKLYANGKPDVAHTTNLVAFLLRDPRGGEPIALRAGALKDVAPTVLEIMGICPPPQMTGQSLLAPRTWGEGRRVLLVICDGWGLGTGDEGDAIFLSSTPYWDSILSSWAGTRLEASGRAVGLGEGKAGNSEAGHTNLGAGRQVMQDDVRLDAAVADGSFLRTPAFLQAIDRAKETGKALHLISYLTKKSSHGSIDYPLAICRMARERGLSRVYLHIILDGRSTPPGSAPAMLRELENQLEEIGCGRIVDGVGRGVVLDRDKNYGKVKLAYDAMVEGRGRTYS